MRPYIWIEGGSAGLRPRGWPEPLNPDSGALRPLAPSGTMPVPQHRAVAVNVVEVFHGGPCLSPRDDML